MRRFAVRFATAALSILAVVSNTAHPDPYPPYWGSAAVHFPPVLWPSEPADPKQCGASCGEWLPYTRFQNNIADPRTQDPSNGGTAPQNYVNIASSCVDKSFPSIYYSLRQGAAPDGGQDTIMFRWRVEQIANTYATGPSAGTYGATDPWNSALWSVLFDVDGDGYVDLAAHLDGSSGSPSAAIDRIAGIWSKLPTQSLDYLGDPTNVKLIAHNPTAFIDSGTSRIFNFQGTNTPVASWPNGAAETKWDYGTSRSKVVTTSPCNEYFIDYQIPVAMLDASSLGGPKITRSTPISMIFCTANSLNNPFQKDCAINRAWIGAGGQPAPFGDYISFDQSAPYSQPIVSAVTATGPNTCPGNYTLTATVQDTLAVINGKVVPSVKAVRFYYYYDTDGNGQADDGNAWTLAADAALKTGSFNIWTASWNATSLAKGQYLIGVQAVDDNTKVDDGMAPSGIDNRTFSYVTGDGQNRIYVGGTSYAVVPLHSPPIAPSASEDWWGNPSVTGTQTALVGVALNTCGLAPTLSKTASASSVVTGANVDFTLTIANPLGTSITLTEIDDTLPAGFTFSSNLGGTLTPTTSPSGGASGALTWTFSPAASVASGGNATLVFRSTASATSGNYNNAATANTSFGMLTSAPVAVAVDSARVSLAKTPSTYSIAPDGATQLVYTLAYSNDSTVPVSAASISDTLPAGVTFVGCSGASCGNSSGVVTWTLGTLAGGATGSVTLTLTVNSNYASSSLTNSATLSATDPAGNPVNKTASSTIAVAIPPAIAPAFTLTKSATPVQIAPGGPVIWTLAYQNYGDGGATGVTISDVLPAGFSFVSCTGGCINSSGTLTWNIGAVASGASGSVTVTATAANPFISPNPAVNTGSINWIENIGSAVSATASVGVTGNACNTYYFRKTTGLVGFDGTKQLATTSPVPQVSDTGGSTTITVPGGANTYSSTVLSFYEDPAAATDVVLAGNTLTTNMYLDRNPGPGITIRTTVYDYNSTTGARVQLGQGTQSFTGSQTGLFTFTVSLTGTLSANHRLLWTYEATSNNSQSTDLLFQYDGTVPNSISDTTPPIATTFADSHANFCVTPPANLTLAKMVDHPSVTGGVATSIQYTLTFANTGQTAATGAQIIDTLPAGVSFVSATLNGLPVTPTQVGQELTFTGVKSLTDLTPGQISGGAFGTIVINATVDASASGSLVNSASISSAQTSAVNATATTTVDSGAGAGTPALAISLAADRTTANPGDTVTYTVTVVNTGTASATSVQISDVLPLAAYYTYGVCSGGCTNSSGTLSWNVGTLATGASVSYTFTMIAGTSGLPAGVTVIPDTASTSATSIAPIASNSVNVSLNGYPNLALSKSANPNSGLEPGDTVTYTAVVTNNGSAAASAVVVTDPIPSGTSFSGNIAATLGSGSFDAIGNRVVFNVGTLASGASATLSFDVTVASLPAGPITIGNTATVSAANAASRTASASAGASADPLLTLQKLAPGQVAYPAATLTQAAVNATTLFVNDTTQIAIGQYVAIGGAPVLVTATSANTITVGTPVTAAAGTSVVGSVSYTLTYQNTGTATATGVTLTDTLPAGATFVTASNGGIESSGVVTWNLGDLDPGVSGTVQVTLIPGAAGTLVNNASITCGACNTPLASASTAAGGLLVTKHTTTPTAVAGGSATYVIDVDNTSGSAIAGVTVTDTLPPGFSYASTTSLVNDGVATVASTSPAAGDTALVWGTFTIQPGKRLTVTFVAAISASAGAATYQNDAGATPLGSTVAFDFLSTTAEDVTVLASGTGVLQGRVFQDNDNDGAFDPAIDAPLGGVDVSITDSTSTLYTVTTDVSGAFSRVVAAGNATVDIDDADIPGGLTLGASFSDPAGVAVPDGGSATKDTGYVAASAVPDLTIAKAHVGNFTQEQTGATFTLTISNAGPGDTSGMVSVADTLPAGLTATDLSGTGWSCVLGTLTCTRSDTLVAGLSYPVITLTVDVALNAGSSLSNVATVSGGGELDTANDGATDATTIDPAAVNADLGITKTNGSSTVNSGASTTYTIVVSNAGPQAADGAVVTDPAAAGLTQTSVSCGSPSGGAVCPSSPTVAQLQAGLAIPTLPSGGSVAFTALANVTAASGSVSNTASVAAPAGVTDANGANNQATDTDSVIVVASSADLTVTKTNGASTVTSGAVTTYTIVVSNAGPQPADGAVVTDPAVAGLSKTSVACGNASGGAVCPGSPTVAQLQGGLAIPALPAGGSVTFSVVTSVTATKGSVSNSASVAPPAGVTDANSGNNAATDSDALSAGVAPATPQSIPTLSTWGLVWLVVAVGFVALRSRRRAR
ncbi:MAG TPA: IPTL-CTERM sorting domain-containing protein [Casimicrobiaceae bacterium]|nr:IPTL-CTERM sorting domain-containing protein [Casimicrobiaceae bacterium]